MRWLLAILMAYALPAEAGTAADIAKAIRENSFDRDECYRVRDVTWVKEDIRIYLNEGYLMFSKPVAGRRIAAVFSGDVEAGDAEVVLMPPNRAERAALSRYTESPTLNEHFRGALFLFTSDEYQSLKNQLSITNRKMPEIGALLDEQWGTVLRNVGASYQTRLTFDLMGGPGRRPGLFAALINGTRRGNFDLVYDPENPEQIIAGQVNTRDGVTFFDTWTSFPSRSFRQQPPRTEDLELRDCRIEATVTPDLHMKAVTRVKVKPVVDGLVAAAFDIASEMEVTSVLVDGREAEVLQREALRQNLTRGGNSLFLVVPPEPLRIGHEYEFELHHDGDVIEQVGDRVFSISARGSWYPLHGMPFVDYDLTFRTPADLNLVSAGDVVEDRVEGDVRIIRRKTATPIRVAAFNLGNYAHAKVERGGFLVDVYANRELERELQPKPQTMPSLPITGRRPGGTVAVGTMIVTPTPPDPTERLKSLADEVASAMEYMSSIFGPPAVNHLTVSPIPGTFGQGFPGVIYLSTLSYLKSLPKTGGAPNEASQMFFTDVLQAHEVAHQWWGNRVLPAGYRDHWLMEALANYSALLYLEKTKGERHTDVMLDSYHDALLLTGDNGQTVDSAGPIALGARLQTSLEPRAWRAITYGKGSWILHMLRRRMGDQQFLAMLREVATRYDRKELSTEAFRQVAASFLPPKSDDPKLELFFEQWVDGTGIPTLKMSHSIKGKAPNVQLVGTITQSDVSDEFAALVPIEIQVARNKTITEWIRTGSTPATFTIPLKAVPLKVSLDPHKSVLRR